MRAESLLGQGKETLCRRWKYLDHWMLSCACDIQNELHAVDWWQVERWPWLCVVCVAEALATNDEYGFGHNPAGILHRTTKKRQGRHEVISCYYCGKESDHKCWVLCYAYTAHHRDTSVTICENTGQLT